MRRDAAFVDAFLSPAKILAQVQSDTVPVPVEIFAQAKSKEAPNDALPNFAECYASHQRVGVLLKENHTGKLIDSWSTTVDGLQTKPELVDMAPAISTFMAIKDEEELVSFIRRMTCHPSHVCAESDPYGSCSDFHPSGPSYRSQVGDHSGQGS
jgi:nucleosome binding factor SPN SPT16 subunit